ncbi:hypothetical protein QE152_g40393, partial [Popillia japonica]
SLSDTLLRIRGDRAGGHRSIPDRSRTLCSAYAAIGPADTARTAEQQHPSSNSNWPWRAIYPALSDSPPDCQFRKRPVLEFELALARNISGVIGFATGLSVSKASCAEYGIVTTNELHERTDTPLTENIPREKNKKSGEF